MKCLSILSANKTRNSLLYTTFSYMQAILDKYVLMGGLQLKLFDLRGINVRIPKGNRTPPTLSNSKSVIQVKHDIELEPKS